MTSKIVPDGCAPIQSGPCPAASATRDVYYGYDVRNLPVFARFDGASGEGLTNSYELGRLTSATTNMGGASRTLTYQNDDAGNRTRITHPDGAYFGMAYDARGLMVHADWWTAATGTVPFVQISYDALGRRTDINRASSFTGYNLDGASRLINQDQRFAGGTGNVGYGFAYNPAGQMKSVSRDNDDFTYADYGVTHRSYTVNGLNQYTGVGGNAISASFRIRAVRAAWR